MIPSVRFVGVRTDASASMVALDRDTLGPGVERERRGAAMVDAGVAFIGEPRRDGDSVWNHDRGPDRHVDELMGRE